MLRQGVLLPRRVDNSDSVVRGQIGQGHLCSIGFLDPWWAVTRTIGGEQQNRRTRQALDQRREIRLRSLIDPMQILDFDDQGALLTALETHLLEYVERARPNRFWR